MTIKDIARMADVSTATVSKVINKKDSKISQKTRDRIFRIIEETGYVPNRVASSMITKKTKSIGLVIPNIANPFFPEVARGAEDKASEAGYSLILCNTDDDMKKEDAYIAMLQEKMVDGIIFTASSRRLKVSDSLKNINVPIVLLDREMEGLQVQGKIMVDNISGAYEAVKYMMDKGYTKVIHLSGPAASTPARHRIEGYKKALKAFGYQEDDHIVIEGDYTSESGYERIELAIKQGIDFNGVFCGNDLIAMGVLKALKANGKIVPYEVGVIGFDDIYLARMIQPELTTVSQPKYLMGYKIAELLIQILNRAEIESSEAVLKTELIIRDTTK
ncbi:LacI family DNA-binding transcriptional regulator [Fusibacter ferrireducens]|uniref:LacI family DNA-binding transcriptional regulator n=1 Tax=Fusibacter ferrireducens TaxID=2785058 RepID=UPI002B48230B|nr:LacI family DNA-binding transcriptional regulator [Fusibacter ferrireducens]